MWVCVCVCARAPVCVIARVVFDASKSNVWSELHTHAAYAGEMAICVCFIQ